MMNDPVNSGNDKAGDAGPDDGAELDPKVQDALGQALKAHYDDLISSPIPDRFLALLAELEIREQQDGPAHSGDKGQVP